MTTSPDVASGPTAPRMAVHRGRLWSTSVDLVVTDPAVLVAASRILHEILARVEATTSRFRDDSELSRVHTVRDRGPVVVSSELYEALALALEAAATTDGAVDPTVGDALLGLGYDVDFERMERDQPGPLPLPAPVPGWRTVHLDRDRSTVALARGVRIDLGATAKAWAADRGAGAVADRLGCGVLVSLGGDLAVAGPPPHGGFAVGIADRCDAPSPGQTVAVRAGGLATSGVGRRRWTRAGCPVHHLVDPSTGRPVDSPWRTVSAAAPTCVEANTATTATMVMGEAGLAWLVARGHPARLVRRDGRVVTLGGWPDARHDGGPDHDRTPDAAPGGGAGPLAAAS